MPPVTERHRERASMEERVWSQIVVVENCWEWLGTRNSHGYAQMSVGGKRKYVHRIMYELRVGPLCDGMTIDHLCRNRGCVNPAHLEQVSVRENTLRGTGFSAKNIAKTHCPKGHPIDGVCSSSLPGSIGVRRFCKTCKSARDVARGKRRRAAMREAGESC